MAKPTPPLLLGAGLAAALAGAGLVGAAPESLLGFAGGELYGHAWVQWWHGQALPSWPAGTDLALGTSRWPVIDPAVTALGGVLSRGIGGVWAWNGVVLLGVAVAFLGGALAARHLGGDPWVGGAVLATSSALAGSLASGLTEDAAVGLLALSLAWIAGGRRAAAGGLLLGLTAWCGLYLGFMGAVAALGLGAALLLRRPEARRPVVWGGMIAAAVTAPALWLQGSRLDGTGHRFGQPGGGFEPLWLLNPWRGADLASFWTPGSPLVPDDALIRLHPAYLGYVALLLALRGGWSRWWWVLLGAMAVAAGPELRWAGNALGVENPAATALSWLPGGDLINHHGRLMLLGQVALAVLAARGAARLRLPGWLLAAAVALEAVLLAPTPLPLPTTPGAIAPLWSSLEGDGAVLAIPLAGPGVHFQRPLYEQRAHGRRLALAPNRPGPAGPVAESELGRWLGAVALPHPPPAPALVDPTDLLAAGIDTVAVRGPWVDRVTTALGPPHQVLDGGASWSLSQLVPEPVPEPSALPSPDDPGPAAIGSSSGGVD